MNEKLDMEAALRVVEQRIDETVRRAADLERAIGVLLGLGADTGAADNALSATYHALGVYTRRRTQIAKVLDSYREAR